MPKQATIQVAGLKVAAPIAADTLPVDLVPADGPPGEPILDLVIGGGALTVRAKVNGRNYRRMMKQVAELGAANLAIILQGTLRPPPAPGEPFVLEGAGFQVNVKTPKVVEAGGEPSA